MNNHKTKLHYIHRTKSIEIGLYCILNMHSLSFFCGRYATNGNVIVIMDAFAAQQLCQSTIGLYLSTRYIQHIQIVDIIHSYHRNWYCMHNINVRVCVCCSVICDTNINHISHFQFCDDFITVILGHHPIRCTCMPHKQCDIVSIGYWKVVRKSELFFSPSFSVCIRVRCMWGNSMLSVCEPHT